MRHVILLDTKITQLEYDRWREKDTVFWEKYIGVTPEYEIMRSSFGDYPTYVDNDGDVRPTDEYLKTLTKQVVAKYGEFGTDFIMMMVHEDNWKSSNPAPGVGIWGTNYSYVFGKQCLEYCRWDRDNEANTFGTAYHERHHSFDAIIKVETNVDIQPILSVRKYDYEITHGHSDNWDYIRYKENTESLKIMAPYLRKSFALRRERHEKILGLYRTIISLMTKLLYLLRQKQAQKNGVPRQ